MRLQPHRLSSQILWVILCIFLASCKSVLIQDTEVCGDKGPLGATCFHTNTTDHRDIDKTQWDLDRVGQLCVTADGFTIWKTALEQLCHETKNCVYGDQLEHIQEELDELDTSFATHQAIPSQNPQGPGAPSFHL